MNHRDKPVWEVLPDPFERAAELLANGQISLVPGRMEFAPVGGNRSILANRQTGITDAINQQVKFREHWRLYSPSILDSAAEQLLPEQFLDGLCVSHTLSAEIGRSSIR